MRNPPVQFAGCVHLAGKKPLTRHAPAGESAGARHPLPKGEGWWFGCGLRYWVPKGTRTRVTTSTGRPPIRVGL